MIGSFVFYRRGTEYFSSSTLITGVDVLVNLPNTDVIHVLLSQFSRFNPATLYVTTFVTCLSSPIIYWLPPMLKHDFVVLHFLPETSYKCPAPLDFRHAPTARVFTRKNGYPYHRTLFQNCLAWYKRRKPQTAFIGNAKGHCNLSESERKDALTDAEFWPATAKFLLTYS